MSNSTYLNCNICYLCPFQHQTQQQTSGDVNVNNQNMRMRNEKPLFFFFNIVIVQRIDNVQQLFQNDYELDNKFKSKSKSYTKNQM